VKDATSRAANMPRGSALLYRNPNLHQQGSDAPEYIGVIKTVAGELYCVLAWNRYVNGKCAIEVTLNPKH
jgi:hypothetical protein